MGWRTLLLPGRTQSSAGPTCVKTLGQQKKQLKKVACRQLSRVFVGIYQGSHVYMVVKGCRTIFQTHE